MSEDFLTKVAFKPETAREIDKDFTAMMQRMREFSPQIREQRRRLELANRITRHRPY